MSTVVVFRKSQNTSCLKRLIVAQVQSVFAGLFQFRLWYDGGEGEVHVVRVCVCLYLGNLFQLLPKTVGCLKMFCSPLWHQNIRCWLRTRQSSQAHLSRTTSRPASSRTSSSSSTKVSRLPPIHKPSIPPMSAEIKKIYCADIFSTQSMQRGNAVCSTRFGKNTSLWRRGVN